MSWLTQTRVCRNKSFVATSILLSKQKTYVLSRQKRICQSWQNGKLVTPKSFVSHDKIMTDEYLSWQQFCQSVVTSMLLLRQKMCFVATNTFLSRQKLCWWWVDVSVVSSDVIWHIRDKSYAGQKRYLWQLPPTTDRGRLHADIAAPNLTKRYSTRKPDLIIIAAKYYSVVGPLVPWLRVPVVHSVTCDFK